MSGGSLEYVYHKVDDSRDTIMERADRSGNALQLAFAEHLTKVSHALHAIEWVYSGDYNEGDEEKAIRACLSPGQILDGVIAVAASQAEKSEKVHALLLEAIKEAKKTG